jgi:hypothetical protein
MPARPLVLGVSCSLARSTVIGEMVCVFLECQAPMNRIVSIMTIHIFTLTIVSPSTKCVVEAHAGWLISLRRRLKTSNQTRFIQKIKTLTARLLAIYFLYLFTHSYKVNAD